METLSIIVIVVAIIILIGLIGLKLYSAIKLKGLRQTAIELIVKAEEMFEKGKNSEKFQSVVEGILDCIPAPLKLFINENTIELFVQTVFDSIKSALDVQPKIDSKTSEDTEEAIEEEE